MRKFRLERNPVLRFRISSWSEDKRDIPWLTFWIYFFTLPLCRNIVSIGFQARESNKEHKLSRPNAIEPMTANPIVGDDLEICLADWQAEMKYSIEASAAQ
jgi:hypothetical protein